MPRIGIVLYREEDGSVPLLPWLDRLPTKVQDKCRLKIERLKALGFELRRPEADFLRDGIYELRVQHARINYRMLYFYHGSAAAVISHGLKKERAVPSREIDKALERKRRFASDPTAHTYVEL